MIDWLVGWLIEKAYKWIRKTFIPSENLGPGPLCELSSKMLAKDILIISEQWMAPDRSSRNCLFSTSPDVIVVVSLTRWWGHQGACYHPGSTRDWNRRWTHILILITVRQWLLPTWHHWCWKRPDHIKKTKSMAELSQFFFCCCL